jgi:mannose-6-phosphate isomerase-like protein (cupin superfamily)
MRLNRLRDAPGYIAPRHHEVAALRLQGHEAGDTEHFWVGLSHYQPGGRAEEAPAREETVYLVLAGELELTCDGRTERLGPYDSAHLAKGEVRSVANPGTEPATLLVVIAHPHEDRP